MATNNTYLTNTYYILRMAITLVLLFSWAAGAEESLAAQKAISFLSQVLNITAAAVIESPDISFETIGLPYKKITVNACHNLWVAEDGSTVYSYSRRNRFTGEDVSGKTHADAISATDAFTAIIPLLAYLGLSTSQSDYEIAFSDIGGETHNDLQGCTWGVRQTIHVNGVLCRSCIFLGRVSAASGAIFSFRYWPIIPQENTSTATISYAEARQTAINWLATQIYLTGASPTLTGDENNGQQVIAPNINGFDISNLLEEQTESTKTYYCWEVPFEWTERGDHTVPGVVWIDVETGAVIGAGH